MAKIQKIHPLNPKNKNSQVGTHLGKNIKVSQPLDFGMTYRSKQRRIPNFKGMGAYYPWEVSP